MQRSLPHLEERGVMTPTGVLFWAKCTKIKSRVLSTRGKSQAELVTIVILEAKDPFLRIKENMGLPSTLIWQAGRLFVSNPY